MATGDLLRRLAAALQSAHAPRAAHARMSPELSYGRHAGPAPATARAAAVIVLLFSRDRATGGARQWYLPLTERPAMLARHGGQVSLPGGAVDVDESSSQAALRELDEELGFTGPLELLGRLPNCYVFASNFLITPWIAATDTDPEWRPHDREVQCVFELPLESLVDESQVGRVTIERGPLAFGAPCLRVGSACVWGATSVMLGQLADVLRTL